MKKIISLFLAILIACSVFSIGCVAFADNGICAECRKRNGMPETRKYISENCYIYYHHNLDAAKDDFGKITVDFIISGKKELVIPATINGEEISKLSSSAFDDNGISETETLTISEGITSVDSFIGKSLKTVYLPASLEYLYDGAFSSCKNLENIIVSSENKNYKTKSGVLFDKKMDVLFAYPANKKSQKYTIPNTITALRSKSFYHADNLKEIVIPASLKSFGFSWETPVNVFLYANSIEKFTVSKSNKKFSAKDGVLFNKNKTVLYAYPCAKSNKSYTIPKTVNRLISDSFTKCKNLKNLKITKNTKRMDFCNFKNCKIKNVYYSGSKNDWKKIYFIDSANEKVAYSRTVTGYTLNKLLKSAKIHYNATI